MCLVIAPVEVDHILRPSPLMQTVDILSDHRLHIPSGVYDGVQKPQHPAIKTPDSCLQYCS